MVHAAAARIAGRSDSDDVAQAVFVLLARKAHRLGGYESLAATSNYGRQTMGWSGSKRLPTRLGKT
jgi:hypothetical protein